MRNKRAGKAVAALAMGIVVAAGLVAVGAKESGPSLTYHELLVLAGDKTQAASAEQDLEAASGLPEAIGEEAAAVSKLKEELEEIDAENSASSEAVPEEMPESGGCLGRKCLGGEHRPGGFLGLGSRRVFRAIQCGGIPCRVRSRQCPVQYSGQQCPHCGGAL